MGQGVLYSIDKDKDNNTVRANILYNASAKTIETYSPVQGIKDGRYVKILGRKTPVLGGESTVHF